MALANDQSESILHMNRILRALFSIAARIRPSYFGKLAPVGPTGGAWALPADLESLYYLETTAGAEVITVPVDDRDVDRTRPAVYQVGSSLFTRGVASLDPVTTDTLNLFYSRKPAALTGPLSPVDSAWPDSFEELLILELAIYYAIKDDRQQELAQLRLERDQELALYAVHLQHQNTTEVGRFPPQQQFGSAEMELIRQLLTGGVSGG